MYFNTLQLFFYPVGTGFLLFYFQTKHVPRHSNCLSQTLSLVCCVHVASLVYLWMKREVIYSIQILGMLFVYFELLVSFLICIWYARQANGPYVISEQQWLWSAYANAQADVGHRLLLKKLTHWRLETPKWVTGKQCRPRSDAAERGVSSGSPLFANSSTIFL